jgi:acetyl-CoA decarbonylase/synthase complex subunit gamma
VAWLDTLGGRVPVVSSQLAFADHFGACKARWGIGRLKYLVPPGLYALGTPDADAPVAVTANYKMSYDLVRRELAGRSIWLLVLETYGINVWCAAGKGTFGSEELIRQILLVKLASIVNHRQLLLPILGAPGVAAHVVKKLTGFTVTYATIRVADLPQFLDNGMQRSPQMQKLTFTAYERVVLAPIELVQGLKQSLPPLALVFLLAGYSSGTFSAATGVYPLIAYLGALLAGSLLTPLLLPILPTRSFAFKGGVLGLAWAAVYVAFLGQEEAWLKLAPIFLIVPALSAFFALNFTGSTPFTSRSGVKKEMRIALPVIACALVAGVVIWGIGRLLI